MEKDLIAIDEIAGEVLTWYDASNRERVAGRTKQRLQPLNRKWLVLGLNIRGSVGLGEKEAAEDWSVVAAVPDVPINGLKEVHFGRHVILLVNSDNEIRAFQGLCPHQLARLGEGMLVDGMIQCPRHLARFNLADGSCSGGWQLAPLRRFEVRVDDGNVLLKDPLVTLD